MAESVTIRSGDTLNQLLKRMRGVDAHRLQEWLKTISVINPHISDLNRIYPVPEQRTAAGGNDPEHHTGDARPGRQGPLAAGNGPHE
jgi:hypothetical protein